MTFEIYWQDLNPDTQKRLEEFLGGENGNYDVFPIATLESEGVCSECKYNYVCGDNDRTEPCNGYESKRG